MKKVYFLFLVVTTVFFSCKKEKENLDPHGGPGVTSHYAYVRGVIIDSVTGAPLHNATTYCSNKAFSTNSDISTLSYTTDVNGMYVLKITWNVGYGYGNTVYFSAPGDSTDLYISSYTSSLCNFFKFKWGQLIENDTLVLPHFFAKPYGYVNIHVKEVPPVSPGIILDCFNLPGSSPTLYFNANTDTMLIQKICPGLKTYTSWANDSDSSPWNTDSVTVTQGDTAHVNVFY